MISRYAGQIGSCAVVSWALAAGTAKAQLPATRPAGPSPAVAPAPEYPGAKRVPARLLNSTMGEGILLPSEPGAFGEEPSRLSGSVTAQASDLPKLLPDGYTVGRRPGRVERRNGGYELILDPIPRLPDAPPLRILPNARLTLLEAILGDGGPERHFVITGRITEFQGANYILLDNIAELAASSDEKASAPSVAAPAAKVAPATQPAAETVNRPSGHEPTAEELINQLMKDKPTRALVFPDEVQPTGTAPASAPVSERPITVSPAPSLERAHWADETLLSDCQARLVPGEAGVWTLAFEDPGKKPTLRPIRILPSKLLETALKLTVGGTKPVVLVVSGEVTAHKGTNYILLRKVLARRNMGNLR